MIHENIEFTVLPQEFTVRSLTFSTCSRQNVAHFTSETTIWGLILKFFFGQMNTKIQKTKSEPPFPLLFLVTQDYNSFKLHNHPSLLYKRDLDGKQGCSFPLCTNLSAETIL